MVEPVEKQIIAVGNGSFKIYLLEQCPNKKPKICLLPQASGDLQGFVASFFTQFLKLNTEPSYLSVIYPDAQVTDMEDYLCSQDISYVTGGNTKTLVGIWKEWEIDKHLKKAYEAGVIMSGISAGAICWFEQGLTVLFQESACL
jgi:dipeptidase E